MNTREDPDAITACRYIVAWLESDDIGPNYGSLTRDTHPEGEKIWREWWERNIALCDKALEMAQAVVSKHDAALKEGTDE